LKNCKIAQPPTAVNKAKAARAFLCVLDFILTPPTESPLGDELNEVKASF